MKIAIIGTGYVGLTTGACFAYLGHEVVCVDVDESKIAQLRAGESPIFEPHLDELIALCDGRLSFTTDYAEAIPGADAAFIAVGTPPLPDGNADLSYVDSAAESLGAHWDGGFLTVVNKSTVPIGSASRVETIVREAYGRQDGGAGGGELHVASNPEFLREGLAIHDSIYPDRVVIGVDDPRSAEVLHAVYQPILDQTFVPPPSVPRPEGLSAVPLVATDVASAELIKYASNGFLALKISFINEVGNLAERVGADIADVARGVGLDARIGPRFLRAGIGWGGSCYAKDTAALMAMAEEHGLEIPIIDSARAVNRRQRELVIEKLSEALGGLQGRRIGLLGLSFKPDTDDLRDAPSIEIANRLISAGAEVRLHDPIAMDRFRAEQRELAEFLCASPDEVAPGCDALVLVTEWRDYLALDWQRLAREMRRPLLFDGRHALDAATLAEAGFRYLSPTTPVSSLDAGRADGLTAAR